MKRIFTLLIILMFFTSSTALSERWLGSGAVVYFSIISVLAMLIFFRKIEIVYNQKLTTALLVFVFFSVLSGLINLDVNVLFSALGYFILFLSATIIIPSFFKENTNKMVTIAILISHVPILLLPILIDGIDTQPYRGIFDNPNALGGVAATVFVVVFAIILQKFESFLYSKEKQSKLVVIPLFIVSSLLFLLVVISGSRTSFVACLLAMFVGVLVFFIFTLKYKLIGNLTVKLFFVFPLFGFVFWITNKFIPITIYVEEIIISKFDRKISDTLAGRDWVWEKAISDSGLFGKGSNYFSTDIGLGAHNTFISILGQYGWLAVIAFVSFVLIGLYYCCKFILTDNEFKYLPLLMLVLFISLSMGEVMLYKLSMLATFILIGVAANDRKIIIKK